MKKRLVDGPVPLGKGFPFRGEGEGDTLPKKYSVLN